MAVVLDGKIMRGKIMGVGLLLRLTPMRRRGILVTPAGEMGAVSRCALGHNKRAIIVAVGCGEVDKGVSVVTRLLNLRKLRFLCSQGIAEGRTQKDFADDRCRSRTG